MAGSVVAFGPSTLSLARAALVEQQLTLPFAAPRTMLNVPIGGARRCAAQSYSLDRVKNIKRAAGVTVNDVVLAMCAGALRYYLLGSACAARHAAGRDGPGKSADQRRKPTAAATWWAASCATSPPTSRIRPIASTRSANRCEATRRCSLELPRLQAFALSAFLMAPMGLAVIPGFVLVGAAAVQYRHLQCAGADRADVLGRRASRRQLSDVDCAGRAGVEHHRWSTTPATSTSDWSDAGEVCRTCSGCSVTWKAH